MYFVLKTAVNDLQKLESTWKLTLVFDRLKTTPDRSSLAAGCTTTLRLLFHFKLSP